MTEQEFWTLAYAAAVIAKEECPAAVADIALEDYLERWHQVENENMH